MLFFIISIASCSASISAATVNEDNVPLMLCLVGDDDDDDDAPDLSPPSLPPLSSSVTCRGSSNGVARLDLTGGTNTAFKDVLVG